MIINIKLHLQEKQIMVTVLLEVLLFYHSNSQKKIQTIAISANYEGHKGKKRLAVGRGEKPQMFASKRSHKVEFELLCLCSHPHSQCVTSWCVCLIRLKVLQLRVPGLQVLVPIQQKNMPQRWSKNSQVKKKKWTINHNFLIQIF